MTWRPPQLGYSAIVFALIGGALLLRYYDPFFTRALRLIAFDNYQLIEPGTYDPNLPVRIVDIDEPSLTRVGQWPWPRTTLRDLLSKLTSNGAAVVAFDVVFAEPDRTSAEAIIKQLPEEVVEVITAAMAGRPSNDELFAAAVRETPSVLSVALGEGRSTELSPKPATPSPAMIQARLSRSSLARAETSQSSRTRHAASAPSTGSPIAIRLSAGSR